MSFSSERHHRIDGRRAARGNIARDQRDDRQECRGADKAQRIAGGDVGESDDAEDREHPAKKPVLPEAIEPRGVAGLNVEDGQRWIGLANLLTHRARNGGG